MNIYLLKRPGEFPGYNQIYQIVVAAETEDVARQTKVDENADGWIPSDRVIVKFIGTAAPHIKPGIILAASTGA